MGRLVIVCARDPARAASLGASVREFVATLRPEGLDVPCHVASDMRGAVLGVCNGADADRTDDASGYVGWVTGAWRTRWREIGTRPVGTYAMVRTSEREIEVVADATASRTLWYACTPELFVASTSQRAIPWFLGGFESNEQAVAWMLASGCIGPRQSWDRRAAPLARGGRLRLDREQWRLTRDEPTVEIEPRTGDHRRRLEEALESVLGDLAVDWTRWRLALSGGNDSRAILQRLRDHRVECVTWGVAAAPWDPHSDAGVARRLAMRAGVGLTYFPVELGTDAVATVLARFVHNGEGRVDHIAGYLDGFALWRSLYESGVRGIIRGDEPFGRHPMLRLDDVCAGLGMHRWSDYPAPPPWLSLDLPSPVLPDDLRYRRHESIDAWRDRLVHAFRLPAVLAALNELKAGHVEIANPLLAGPLVEIARSLPDELRTDKRLFRALTNCSIPLARRGAIASSAHLQTHVGLRAILRADATSGRTRANFGRAYAEWLGDALDRTPTEAPSHGSWRGRVGRLVPRDLRRRWSPPRPKRHLCAVQLALRTFLVNEMFERLAVAGRSRDADVRVA